MKRLLISLVLLMAGSFAFAETATLPRSSFTATSDNGVYISSSGYLTSVTIGVATANGSLVIYDSTWTKTSVVISSISLGTVFQYDFHDQPVKGLFYVAGTATNGVTIQYKLK